ncbi:MAG: quinolinate synthase NadA [Deltaproteobacteria bacterium]|nr:quinolinate synthase NadA [Deltaproteobacteria bacterium]
MDSPPDVLARIDRLRRERNAVILAHYYQEPDIQDLADHVGDSLQLAQAARRSDAEVIVFCGVHFMAETAAILCPERIVLLPDLAAGCSLADACPAPALAAWKAAHPHHAVVSYINCTAAVKALSDIVCTSSNAVRVVESLPPDRPVLFLPDRHLGRWVAERTGRPLDLWPGTCIVHEAFSEPALLDLVARHPDAKVLAHPECTASILARADHVGSTSSLLAYALRSDASTFVVATEPGILHPMRRAAPDKTFLPLPGVGADRAFNVCPHMRLITPEKTLRSLETLEFRIEVPEAVRTAALVPLERMLALQ